MSVAQIAVGILLSALPFALLVAAYRKLGRLRQIPRQLWLLAVAGVLGGALAAAFEHWALGWSGLSFKVLESGALGALAAMLLLAVPLEEALKALTLAPLYARQQIRSERRGLALAVCVAVGFSSGEVALTTAFDGATLESVFRWLMTLPAQLFFSGLWGYALGSRSRGQGRWFSWAWFSAVVLRGLYDHIAFGYGPGLLVLLLPLLGSMLVIAWILFRDLAPQTSSRVRSSTLLLDPPSLGAMRRAMRRNERPLMLHWIGFGAFVTLGVMIVLFAGAVYLGHRIGLDFALVEEADIRATGPLILLGTAVLLAFPFAGYLIARASSADSVLEPAMGAGIAIVLLLGMLSMTEPVAVVFALAVAPVAFGLACGGAWFGLR